jgi:uncharacterized protein (DUF697 family)
MSSLSGIGNLWNNVKEIDLRPLREEALQVVRIVITGRPGSGRETLAGQMRRDPSRPSVERNTPISVLDLESAQEGDQAELVILMVDPRQQDLEPEAAWARHWNKLGKKVLVFVNQGFASGQMDGSVRSKSRSDLRPWIDWGQSRVIYGPVEDTAFLLEIFVPVVVDLLADHQLSLGRHYPLFRVEIARRLINDTSLTNGTYSLSTGLAEIVPVFDIPLNVADMVVLSKAQAFLVYKLGLALGMSTQWQDYVAEFGSVLGGGFLWRQLARSLIGLIPAWGIVPKVAVAYAGTYVVGSVVLQWYLTGRHISREQMQQLYRQAFERGKQAARELISRAPRPRLPRPRLPRLGRRRRNQRPQLPAGKEGEQICPACGRTSAADASYCQYCGTQLEEQGVGE